MQGCHSEESAQELAAEKLADGYWVRIYGPENDRTDGLAYDWLVNWSRRGPSGG